MTKYPYKFLFFLFTALSFQACKYEIQDIEKVQEKLELQASSTDIVLDPDHLTDDIITFTWTDAREVSDDHIVTYTTKLDVVGNNFGSSTTIMNYEDEGTNIRSFTSEQINNWANEKWGIPVNRAFTLEFRIIAEWEGGPTFEAPEVRTIRVNVQPIRTVVFDADQVFLDGTAVPGISRVEMMPTPENASQYAILLDLEPGSLEIPVDFNGETNYIAPTAGSGVWGYGEPIAVNMREDAVAWQIETAGQYRVIINMQRATVTIYSPENPLQPAVVQWVTGGVTQTTTVNNLWEYGEPTGWSWRTGNWKQSLADPQIFVYSGPGLAGRTKFGVHNSNDAYVYTGNAATTAVTLGTSMNLTSGYTTERNFYFGLPSGTNFIILDLRNKTMIANRR